MGARRLWGTLAVAAAVLAAAPPLAHAQTAEEKAALKVFQDYVTDGRLDPCRHTSKELELAQRSIPPDIEQYAADYPAAIAAAIEARARGDCAGTDPAKGLIPRATPEATPSATPEPTPEPTPVPTAIPTKTVVPEPPAPEVAEATPTATAASAPDVALERVATATPANDAPAPVLLLGILAALLAAAGLAALAIQRMERFAGARHAWSEAAWRASGAWADFRDWLRLGR